MELAAFLGFFVFVIILIFFIKWADLKSRKVIFNASFRFEGGMVDIQPKTSVPVYLYKDKITLNDIQIIPLDRVKNIDSFTTKEIDFKNKSVIGRAALGGLFLGPLGAVIGGMSGVGNKKEINETYFLTIRFVDKQGNDKELLFSSISNIPKIFTEVANKYINKNNSLPPTELDSTAKTPYEL